MELQGHGIKWNKSVIKIKKDKGILIEQGHQNNSEGLLAGSEKAEVFTSCANVVRMMTENENEEENLGRNEKIGKCFCSAEFFS